MNLWTIRSLTLAIALLISIGAMAQTSTAPATAAGPQLLKPAQLDQLVAPIALYPDPLLSEVLMASAYPLEVVAGRTMVASQQENLKGDQLKAALDKQHWDASIKSLVATPSVLEMMSTSSIGRKSSAMRSSPSRRMSWTPSSGCVQRLSQQQADVDQAADRHRRTSEGKQVIAIEPMNPDTVYVPYYDPAVVYGAWPYPDYPPYYWEPPYYIGAELLATGLAFRRRIRSRELGWILEGRRQLERWWQQHHCQPAWKPARQPAWPQAQ